MLEIGRILTGRQFVEEDRRCPKIPITTLNHRPRQFTLERLIDFLAVKARKRLGHSHQISEVQRSMQMRMELCEDRI
jgi:hypothetical protein